MITAQELRLGNYLNFIAHFPETGPEEFTGGRITGIMPDCVYLNEIKMPKLADLRGIPLTNEWMLKAGFVLDRSIGVWFGESPFTVWTGYKTIDGDMIDFKFSIDARITIPVKYVHSLQNLYFVIMGKELTFIEPV